MIAPAPSSVTGAAILLGALSLFGLLIRQIGPWRHDLIGRIQKLEGKLDAERARCDAELGVHRHEIAGLWQLNYSLLHLFDVPATRRKELLAGIRTDIAALKEATALEKAAIAAAAIKETAE